MNTIPPDIYEHVGELAADITNATLADDHALAESLYQRLHLYHEEQLAAGRSHPFIIETLADYTDDPAQAIRYYEQALAMLRRMTSDEPTHTILIGMGEQLIELGRREQAEVFIRNGRAEALRRGDTDWVVPFESTGDKRPHVSIVKLPERSTMQHLRCIYFYRTAGGPAREHPLSGSSRVKGNFHARFLGGRGRPNRLRLPVCLRISL